MSITRFRAPGLDLHGLGEALARWYVAQDLESDATAVPGGVVVRCRSRGGHALIGTSRGLTVVLRQDGLDLAVEMGAARWSDKAWVAGAGVLLISAGPVGLIPLATSAVGAWRQWRLPTQTLDFLRATAPSFSGARTGTQTTADVGAPPPAQPPPAPATASPAAPLDVNTAGAHALAQVPGLDATVARDLADARDRIGGFRSWEQVRDLLARSLPPHRLTQARPWLTVGVPRPTGHSRGTSSRGPLDL